MYIKYISLSLYNKNDLDGFLSNLNNNNIVIFI